MFSTEIDELAADHVSPYGSANEFVGATAEWTEMKRCTACAEEIQDAAVKCRFCGEAQKPILDQADITAASEEINALLSQGKKSEALSLSIQLRDKIQGAANVSDFAKYLAGTESAIIALGKSSRNPVHFIGGGVIVVVLMGLILSLRSHPGGRSQAVDTRVHQSGDSEKSVASETAVPVIPPVAIATPTPIAIAPIATAAPIAIAPIAIPTSTPTPLISAEYLASARKAFDGLRGLQSIVQVGISYANYPTRLQDCQILVDRFIQDNSTEQIPGLGEEMTQAMAAYNEANTVWAIKFEGDSVQGLILFEDSRLPIAFSKFPDLKADLARTGAKGHYGYLTDAVVSTLWEYAGKHVDAVHELIDRYAAK